MAAFVLVALSAALAAADSSASLFSSLANKFEDLKCQLCEVPRLQELGKIDGCCCDVKTAERSNNQAFLPILHELTKR